VDDYFKQLDTLLIRVNMDESEEAKIARFVSGLRRDIQDVVELQEYSSLENVMHLASKIENQLARKNAFKNHSKDNYYHSSLIVFKKDEKFESPFLVINITHLG